MNEPHGRECLPGQRDTRLRIERRQRWTVAVSVAWLLATGSSSAAQVRVSFAPSLEVAGVYDDNLFAVPDDQVRATDTIRRFGSQVSAEVETSRSTLTGSYGLESEQYSHHPDLSTPLARQQGQLSLEHDVTSRASLAIATTYFDTTTPGELNQSTGLTSTRVRARRLTVGPTAHHELGPRTTVHGSYGWTSETVVASSELRAHAGSLWLDRSLTPRDTLRVSYDLTSFVFDRVRTTRTQSMRVQWQRKFDTRTSLIVDIGPRVTDASPSTDVSASLTHVLGEGALSIDYLRAETTAIGLVGTLHTERLQGRLAYEPLRRLGIHAAPAVFRIRQDRHEARILRLTFGGAYILTSVLAIEFAYNLDIQHGGIDPSRSPHDRISRHVVEFHLRTGSFEGST